MKIRYELSLPFLLFLFAFQSASYAATVTWTGDVSTAWNDTGNWSGGAIPNSTDDVIIPSGRPNDPVIESPLFILLVSMVVESGATLTINSGATLAIDNALGDGIDNAGTINNAGIVNISNVASRGIFSHSGAVFTNSDGARISVGFNNGSIGGRGISNLGSTSLFTNEGQIQIDSTTSNGLVNEGTFNNQNSGSLEIGLMATINALGIQNTGTFNSAGDTIKIANTRTAGIITGGIFHNTSVMVLENIGVTGGAGILNNSGGSFINDSTINIGTNDLRIRSNGIQNDGSNTDFQNNGIINIERTNDAGIRNLRGATFTNSDMAIINIGQNNRRINREGIFNLNGATSFINAGTINIDNTGFNGVFNQSGASFDNVVNGKLHIGKNAGSIGRNGILTPSNFSNSGTITIDNTRDNGVVNQGTFNNAASAQLNIGQNNDDVRIGIVNAASSTAFTNSGIITIDSTRIDGLLNEGTFTNQDNGKIQIGLVASINNAGILNRRIFKQTGDTIKIANTGTVGINNQDSLINAGLFIIENTTASGILNNMEAVFINDSTINVGTNNLPTGENGIQNQGSGTDFQNNGTINIERTNAPAIQNAVKGKFTNSVAALLNIGQDNGSIVRDGIRNTDDSTAFFNFGVIHIDNTVDIGNTMDAGIVNRLGAAFNNAENAMLKIGQKDGNIGENGIQNLDNSTVFINEGIIQLDSVGTDGVLNESIFTNQSTGKIQIGLVARIGNRGILNTGVFNHLGDTIKITDTGVSSIENEDTFNNVGLIIIENTRGRGITNGSGGVFTNDSTINIGTNNLAVNDAGIRNQDVNTTFQNNNIINIERANTIGIQNISGSGFTNTADAVVNIGQNNGSVNIGIFVGDDGSSFTNIGIINIDNTTNSGIENRVDFNNVTDAIINIGQNDGNIGGQGILNLSARARFINEGMTYIDNTNNNGIRNEDGGFFDNTITAHLNIGQNDGNIGGQGISNLNAVTFNNSGTITIDRTVGNGISNTMNAASNNTGAIKIGQIGTIGENGIRLVNGSSFKNIGGQIDVDNLGNSVSGINISNAQFIDSTGVIRLGLNHPFGQDAFIINNINNNAAFTGNDSTTIECVGNFFIGAGSTVSGIGELELEGDWENNATFSADSSSVTIIGATQSIIGGSNTTTFFDLTINNSGNVVLENNVTVTRQLSLEAGQVSLGDNDFTLGDEYELLTQVGTSALVTDGLGEVVSTVDNVASRIFPVGNTNYTPITIQNDGTSDEFSVQCLPEVLQDGTSGSAFTAGVVNTTWLVEESVAGGSDVTLTAQWTSVDELSGFDRTNAYLAHYLNGRWMDDNPSIANGTDPYTISRSNITEFSPFAVGTGTVLPVELTYFKATAAKDHALLSWETASELNNDYFSIERSYDGKSFKAIGKVEGAGTSLEAQQYEFIDRTVDVSQENVYYRLQQVDYDQSYAYTDISVVAFEQEALLLTLSPNPTSDQLTIQNAIGRATIVNTLGQVMQTFEIQDDLHTVDVSGLPSGQYLLVILGENGERVTSAFTK